MNANDLPIHREFPSEMAYSLAVRRYDFRPVAIATGTQPVLPDGSLGVTDHDAVGAGAKTLGPPRDGVEVAAQYGLLSAPLPAVHHPGGDWEPLYQDKPVWIVAFYGPGVAVRVSRGVTALGVDAERSVPHEMHALVDAKTGGLLSIFN